MILGLLSTEDYAAERFKSVRRSVFYKYPNGAAPLIGLLSMLEGEVLNDPEFSWYEDRLIELRTVTEAAGGGGGFWYADSTGARGSIVGAGASARTAGVAYHIRVDDYNRFRPNDIIVIKKCTITGGTTDIQVRVLPHTDGVWYDTTSYTTVRVTPIITIANVTNADTGNDDLECIVLGNANQQGQTGSYEGTYFLPSSQLNAAMIHRTPFSFTGTAIVTSAKYDESGPYQDKAKKFSMNHMIQMELQTFFGEYSKEVDATTGLPRFTSAGVLTFLRLYEVGNGNTYRGLTNNYGNAAATVHTDDEKLIITPPSGNITDTLLDDYYERLFRKSNDVVDEKVFMCGSGFLNVINKLYKGNVQLETMAPVDAYGMNVVRHVTPFGTVFYKTHPLFSRNASLRYNALAMDVQNMKYRYVEGRDTDIVRNIQPNNADYRQDEWKTECGLELVFPEAFMYFEDITGIA